MSGVLFEKRCVVLAFVVVASITLFLPFFLILRLQKTKLNRNNDSNNNNNNNENELILKNKHSKPIIFFQRHDIPVKGKGEKGEGEKGEGGGHQRPFILFSPGGEVGGGENSGKISDYFRRSAKVYHKTIAVYSPFASHIAAENEFLMRLDNACRLISVDLLLVHGDNIVKNDNHPLRGVHLNDIPLQVGDPLSSIRYPPHTPPYNTHSQHLPLPPLCIEQTL